MSMWMDVVSGVAVLGMYNEPHDDEVHWYVVMRILNFCRDEKLCSP